ncbi:MAG TPA: hypothetical protein VHW24_12080 [Bryobacteraceae bacterium]|jgi:hypothetical protein|nr:hypothetical protein [Bryobacteraceae bacterium]
MSTKRVRSRIVDLVAEAAEAAIGLAAAVVVVAVVVLAAAAVRAVVVAGANRAGSFCL